MRARGRAPCPGAECPELPLSPARHPRTRRAPCGREQGGGAPAAVPRGSRQRPGGSGQRGGSAGLRRARPGYLRAALPPAGRGSSLRSPAAPRSIIEYFVTGTRHRSLRPSPTPARRCESPASLQTPCPPLPPHSACRPGLINLIHLELIVFTFASHPSPPSPAGGGWGRSGGRGAAAAAAAGAERSGGAARFEPRQRHLSSAGQCRAQGRDRTGRDGLGWVPPVVSRTPPQSPRSRPTTASPSVSHHGPGRSAASGAARLDFPTGLYGNIDRIKVTCNSVINEMSLVSKIKCGAIKLFI